MQVFQGIKVTIVTFIHQMREENAKLNCFLAYQGRIKKATKDLECLLEAVDREERK